MEDADEGLWLLGTSEPNSRARGSKRTGHPKLRKTPIAQRVQVAWKVNENRKKKKGRRPHLSQDAWSAHLVELGKPPQAPIAKDFPRPATFEAAAKGGGVCDFWPASCRYAWPKVQVWGALALIIGTSRDVLRFAFLDVSLRSKLI